MNFLIIKILRGRRLRPGESLAHFSLGWRSQSQRLDVFVQIGPRSAALSALASYAELVSSCVLLFSRQRTSACQASF